jgi:phosphatidylglycerophosphate synthase
VLANLLTLSRFGVGAWLAVVARRRKRSCGAWLALLWGCTLSDWLDGPLARRAAGGDRRLGAILDLEADSWLSLWGALAAWRCGTLPWVNLVAPLLRYPLQLARSPSRRVRVEFWQRVAGTLQMVVVCAGLSPWQTFHRVAACLALPAAGAQLVTLLPDVLAASWSRPGWSPTLRSHRVPSQPCQESRG